MTNEDFRPEDFEAHDADPREAQTHDAEGGAAEQAAPETPEATSDNATDAAGATGADDVVELSELDTALLRVAELEEEVARRKADLYNLGQEYNGYVKRSKAEARVQYDTGVTRVLELLLPVLDDAELARQHGDLTGPAGAVADKLEQTLEVNFGLTRYGAPGDEFDPELHEALMNETDPEVTVQQVRHILQPGYKQGEKVVRPARVGVVSPE